MYDCVTMICMIPFGKLSKEFVQTQQALWRTVWIWKLLHFPVQHDYHRSGRGGYQNCNYILDWQPMDKLEVSVPLGLHFLCLVLLLVLDTLRNFDNWRASLGYLLHCLWSACLSRAAWWVADHQNGSSQGSLLFANVEERYSKWSEGIQMAKGQDVAE